MRLLRSIWRLLKAKWRERMAMRAWRRAFKTTKRARGERNDRHLLEFGENSTSAQCRATRRMNASPHPTASIWRCIARPSGARPRARQARRPTGRDRDLRPTSRHSHTPREGALLPAVWSVGRARLHLRDERAELPRRPQDRVPSPSGPPLVRCLLLHEGSSARLGGAPTLDDLPRAAGRAAEAPRADARIQPEAPGPASFPQGGARGSRCAGGSRRIVGSSSYD